VGEWERPEGVGEWERPEGVWEGSGEGGKCGRSELWEGVYGRWEVGTWEESR
jgi:hypothetical protein